MWQVETLVAFWDKLFLVDKADATRCTLMTIGAILFILERMLTQLEVDLRSDDALEEFKGVMAQISNQVSAESLLEVRVLIWWRMVALHSQQLIGDCLV